MPHIPKPFVRPKISIPERDKQREWRNVPAGELAVGDLIADHGKIQFGEHRRWHDPARMVLVHKVTFRFLSGNEKTFDAEETVFAFTEPR